MRHLERLMGHLGWADRQALDALKQSDSVEPAIVEVYAHLLAADNLERLTTFVTRLAPEDLGRGVTYRNSAGQQFTSAVEDILLHLCLHGAYHRGQIAWALRRGGAIPVSTDFIAFVRGAPAATRGKDTR